MSNFRRLAVRLICLNLIAAPYAGLPAFASAQEALPGVVQEPEQGPAAKRGRITPFNGAALPEDEVPSLQPPTDTQKSDKKPDEAIKPSDGVGVFDRMGAMLPALPAEKPFGGKPDDAYGAFQRGYYLTAMELALPKAQLGDPAAQTLVAEIFAQGLGVARNTKDAAFWYEQAAKAGNPAAMFKYALILMEGRDVPRDRKRSEEMMKKAADAGNALAQFNYGQLLVADTPGPNGLKAAQPYYEKSALQGIADAQYALSQIYLNVDGIDEAKRETARQWLGRAAKAGYDTAQLDLAIWLVDGIGGDRNLEEGFKWMRRAAERGNVVAQNKLSHLYINAIGTRPDPVEAAKWYVLSRRAGLADPVLEDFYLGLEEAQQKAALAAANKHRGG